MSIKPEIGDEECKGCLSYRKHLIYTKKTNAGHCQHVNISRYREFRENCACKNCIVKSTCPPKGKTSGSIGSSKEMFCPYFCDSVRKYLRGIIHER